jgi:hypothetical protein
VVKEEDFIGKKCVLFFKTPPWIVGCFSGSSSRGLAIPLMPSRRDQANRVIELTGAKPARPKLFSPKRDFILTSLLSVSLCFHTPHHLFPFENPYR